MTGPSLIAIPHLSLYIHLENSHGILMSLMEIREVLTIKKAEPKGSALS
jgi:hypothetical protein